MTSLIRYSVFGLCFFLFLCITINNKPIFSHIYSVISPATKGTQRAVEGLFASAYQSTERFSKKLFLNSNPKSRDAIRSSAAAPKRSSELPQENVDHHDREQLDDLIKSHR